MPRSLVFDLDGTLIDSLPDVVGALNLLLAEEDRRRISVAEGARMVGNGAAAMVERAFAATGAGVPDGRLASLTRRYIGHYRATPVRDTTIYPGVLDVLNRFASAGVAMGICTNKPDGMSRIVIAALGLDRYFGAVVGGDVLPVKKPDAGHVFAVLDAMGASRAGSVFVGDSATDLSAARNAGLRAVMVSYGYARTNVRDMDADIVIDAFSDLPEALVSLPIASVGPTTENR